MFDDVLDDHVDVVSQLCRNGDDRCRFRDCSGDEVYDLLLMLFGLLITDQVHFVSAQQCISTGSSTETKSCSLQDNDVFEPHDFDGSQMF